MMGQSLLVAFEGGEEDHAMAPWILAVGVDDCGGYGAEQALVVGSRHARLGCRQPGFEVAALLLVVEHSGIERLLIGKMPEDDGFVDTSRRGDFFRRGAFEAAAGKDLQRGFEKLLAAIDSGHAAVVPGVSHSQIVSECLLICQSFS